MLRPFFVEPKFHYGDEVKFTSGFYSGMSGKVTGLHGVYYQVWIEEAWRSEYSAKERQLELISEKKKESVQEAEKNPL